MDRFSRLLNVGPSCEPSFFESFTKGRRALAFPLGIWRRKGFICRPFHGLRWECVCFFFSLVLFCKEYEVVQYFCLFFISISVLHLTLIYWYLGIRYTHGWWVFDPTQSVCEETEIWEMLSLINAVSLAIRETHQCCSVKCLTKSKSSYPSISLSVVHWGKLSSWFPLP